MTTFNDLIQTQQVWFSSDHHFGHERVIAYDGRPFQDSEEMDAEMICRWNALIGPDDVVVYLGDLSFHKAERTREIVRALRGNKYLVLGNHDKGRSVTWWKNAGFLDVWDEQEASFHGTPVQLSHYPYRGKEHDDRTFTRQLSDKGLPLFHGHVHTRWTNKGLMVNVGVTQWSYAPVLLEEVWERLVS